MGYCWSNRTASSIAGLVLLLAFSAPSHSTSDVATVEKLLAQIEVLTARLDALEATKQIPTTQYRTPTAKAEPTSSLPV